ncbi:MAG: hypothetical protein HY854_21940 [Burkholderiales bacterium]|nr:hypothetical protein [Burkholderiales bacterium]
MAAHVALLLVVGLAATASHAAGTHQWVSYGESEVGVHYFDSSSVKSVGNLRRVWRLIDRREPLGNGIHSGTALIEIDCRAGTYRYLQTRQYSGRMGQGRYLGGDREQPVEHISPGSMAGYLSQLVCS